MKTLARGSDGVGFRAALKELNQTEESFAKILSQAREKSLGNGDGDLERIKAQIVLKFGTIELSTEQAFLKAVLESQPLPKDAPTESEGFKALQQRLKNLTSENERRAEEMEREIERLSARSTRRFAGAQGVDRGCRGIANVGGGGRRRGVGSQGW